MKKFCCFVFTACFLLSCNKDNAGAGKPVEFYQLESFNYVANKCMVDSSSAILKSDPFINNADIIAYSKSAFTYKLSAAAINRVKALQGRVPFAVTVDKQVVYFAFFNEVILSSSCEHSISMDLDLGSSDKILLKLGYPGALQGVPINDQRNNPLLLSALSSQGKLK